MGYWPQIVPCGYSNSTSTQRDSGTASRKLKGVTYHQWSHIAFHPNQADVSSSRSRFREMRSLRRAVAYGRDQGGVNGRPADVRKLNTSSPSPGCRLDAYAGSDRRISTKMASRRYSETGGEPRFWNWKKTPSKPQPRFGQHTSSIIRLISCLTMTIAYERCHRRFRTP